MRCLGDGRPEGSRQVISGNANLAVYSFSEEAAETKCAYFAKADVPNALDGLAFDPSGKEFYTSGGPDDDIHFYGLTGGTILRTMTQLPLPADNAKKDEANEIDEVLRAPDICMACPFASLLCSWHEPGSRDGAGASTATR
jgi:hypothetical protein